MTALVEQERQTSIIPDTEDVLRRALGGDRDVEASLLELLATLPAAHPDRAAVRQQLVVLYMPLAKHFARRMCQQDSLLEDLTQVAMIGLIKAVDGFDHSRGVAFAGYASPTIIGELKRYFRDKGWSVRVPRRLQELKAEVAKASEELAQRIGVRPSSSQLAEHMGIPERDVAEALEAATAQYATSLQTLVGSSSGEAVELGELLGDVDPALEAVELRLMLRTAAAGLAPREQRIITMRFADNLTQSEIAEELGISQMHVSRLLTRVLADLRATLTK